MSLDLASWESVGKEEEERRAGLVWLCGYIDPLSVLMASVKEISWQDHIEMNMIL